MKDIVAYWYWDKEISYEICQKIISLGEGNWNQATIGTNPHEIGPFDKKDVRKSDVAWINDQWVYDLIWSYMVSANEQAGWKYEIVAAEDCQVTRYTKKGFYAWHRDGTGSHNEIINKPGNKFLHGNVRKLSMSLILNNDYENGNFEMGKLFSKDKVPRLKEGSIIVFPSFMEHRVTPVTKGTRYSLVAWFVGPPFV